MEIVLLDQKKNIAQLVVPDVNQSIVEFIKTELSKDEYSFIVTVDNLKFAKDKMADLNKSIKFVTEFRKDKVDAESVAIDAFKDNVKEYVGLINEKREQIKKDVEVFESETKKAVEKELSLYADQLSGDAALRLEFNKVDFSDLIVLGSITAKGALTKKAREVVEGRVMACKSKQDKYDMRLLQLENISYKSGLESPLTLTHVQGIIYLEDDAEYGIGLDSLIASEIERQNVMKKNIEAKAKEEAEKNARQDILDGQNRIRSIFQGGWSTKIMTLDEVRLKINEFTNYDFSQFSQEKDFAENMADDQIRILKKIEWSMLEREKASNAAIEKEKELQLKDQFTKDTGLSTQQEVYEAMKENAGIHSDQVTDADDGKKIVIIRAEFAIKAHNRIEDALVLSKFIDLLNGSEIDGDTIRSIEVV